MADLETHRRMHAERQKWLETIPDHLLRKPEPPPAPVVPSFGEMEVSEKTARQMRRAQAMQQMLAAEEAEKKPKNVWKPGPLAQLLMRR